MSAAELPVDIGRRDHVFGQLGGEVRAQRFGSNLLARIVGQQTLAPAPIPVFARCHHCLSHFGMIGQLRLNLAQFNPKAADFDLEVGASQELDFAVLQPAA